MRPTGVEGLWFNVLDIPKTKIEGGYLWAISPRSTVRWYYMGESLGLYGVGVDAKGVQSGYAGHTESHYVASLGIHRELGEHRIHIWNFHVDNLFNSTLAQADLSFPTSNGKFIVGLQAIKQYGIGVGGNDNGKFALHRSQFKIQCIFNTIGLGRFKKSIHLELYTDNKRG